MDVASPSETSATQRVVVMCHARHCIFFTSIRHPDSCLALQLRTQSPFAMDFAVDAAKPSEIIDSQVLVMEETQPVALHQPNKGTKDSKS